MFLFFFLMIRRPPRSTLFPYRRSSDLAGKCLETTFANKFRFHLKPGEAIEIQIRAANNGGESQPDRKSTRLNSSHQIISYAVFCLKKKKKKKIKYKQRKKTKQNIIQTN